MKKFAAVLADGTIGYTISPSLDDHYQDGQVVGDYTMIEFPIELSDYDVHTNMVYVNGSLVEKAPNTVNLVENNTLVGLPVPCTILINEKEYPCTEALAEIEFTYVGTYKIVVKATGYYDKEFTVTK